MRLVQHPHIEGKVDDAFVSHVNGWRYEFSNNVGTFFAKEDELEMVREKGYSMTINIDIAENVVIATLYEEAADSKSILAKGHGHMIHEGELGIAQAASYACKRLYKRLGGTITKGGSWR